MDGDLFSRVKVLCVLPSFDSHQKNCYVLCVGYCCLLVSRRNVCFWTLHMFVFEYCARFCLFNWTAMYALERRGQITSLGLCPVISDQVVFKCVRKIEKRRYKPLALCLPVRVSEWYTLAGTGRIFMKFDIWVVFENLPRKLRFHSNLTRITGTLHEDRYTICIVSRPFLRKMKNVSNRSCR